MPSGAKKRKAAKKKKENQSSNLSHLNGDEDRESDAGENTSPKSQGQEEETAEGQKVKSDEKHLDVRESEDDDSDKKHERDGGSSRSGSNSDDENLGGIKNTKAESNIDSTEVGDFVSIEATCNPPIVDSVAGKKTPLLIEQVELHNEQSPSDISVAAPCVVQSAIRENGEKRSVEDKISSSLERTIEQSDAKPTNNTESEDPRECVKQEFDNTTALQYNAPQPNNHVKDSLVIQPLFTGEKTSWKSCCGLFEVFARSAA